MSSAKKSYIMKTLLMATVGWLVACPACAQVGSQGNQEGMDASVPSFLFEFMDTPQLSAATISYNFDSTGRNTIFGYVGLPGESALGPPGALIRRYSGIDSPDALRASHWLDPAQSPATEVTVGYAWRDLKVEGSVLSGTVDESHNLIKKDLSKLSSKSARLSFNPAQNWALQISRGSVLGLDQLVPGGEVRRTLASASYIHAFESGDWQTTLGWGRNSKKFRQSTTGYLLESMFRFSGKHAVFGRLEQVGSDELWREDESIQRQFFKMEKLTIGYFHEFKPTGPVKADVGGMVSRHFVPAAMAPIYGDQPTTYMMFVRLKLQ
jgi:hypothetical protein